MSNSSSEQVKSLQNSITYMWQPTKTALEGKQADDALLRTFFKNWEGADEKELKSGDSSQQAAKDGYREAVSEIVKGTPNIPNSKITESQLLEKIKKVLGKPLDPVDTFDIKKFEANIEGLKKDLRRNLAMGFFSDSQIKSLNDKIDQLNKQTGDPMYGESPDSGYEDNFLS